MAAAGAEAAAVAAEEEKRLPEGDPESGGDSEDEGDSDSSGDGEDEEKENEAEIQRLEEQVRPARAGGSVGRGRWGSAAASARSRLLARGKRCWGPGLALVASPLCCGRRPCPGRPAGAAPGLWGRLVPQNRGLPSGEPRGGVRPPRPSRGLPFRDCPLEWPRR